MLGIINVIKGIRENYLNKLFYTHIIEVDKTLFTHLLSNIIGNAFKYSKGKSHYLLKVKDNGIGFDSRNAKNIFKPFKRLVGHNHSEGSVLGLSICNRIVQQHGGEIWTKSEEGKGAQFFIELPVHNHVK